jgi:oxalate decarboxylase/phosphoglucose isomerase-like protein (cupin superfamily)
MNISEEAANDAIKVAPDLHEVIFENDKLRVLKVRVKPGDVADMHWHPENINYILAGGKLRFTKPDGAVVEVELTEGQVTSSPAGSHAVENTGDTEVQTVQVELKET